MSVKDHNEHNAPISNAEIADLLDETAELLELAAENPFRIRAYRKASRTIREYGKSISEFVKNPSHRLRDLTGIGYDLEGKILAILSTGTFPLLEVERAKHPSSMRELLRIRGLGAKKVSRLYHEMGIKSIDELKRAAENHSLSKMKGFAKKTAENILSGIDLLQKKSGRILISDAHSLAQAILEHLKHVNGLAKIEVAGSFRRRKETIGDLDILAVCRNRQELMDQLASFHPVKNIDARGPTRMTVRLNDGFQIDLRIVPAASWGAALIYFTGSKDHNIELRRQALAKGLKINEYGVFRENRHIAGRTEDDVYKSVGLNWIPPELREMKHEFQIAAKKQFPPLVDIFDIKGDLHIHTTATDGQNTTSEMIEAAVNRGYKYMAFTEHSKRVSIAHGLDSNGIRSYWKAIDRIQDKYTSITLLRGVEVDILEDGTLDLSDSILREADWVIAAVHYNHSQSSDAMTKRLLKVIQHPSVSAIAHPTGRLIGTRNAYQADFNEVFRAAADYGCLLEINGQPARLDLNEDLLETAMKYDVEFVLNSDAHSIAELSFMQFAVDQARRANLPPSRIFNTRPWSSKRKAK